MILPYKEFYPSVHKDAFIANNATITGDVEIAKDVSIWFGAVIRGDVAPTIIGERTNIQDLTMIHQSPNKPVIIEEDVTIGHQATIHSPIIRKNALIGMGAIILDGAEIGEHAFIGAGALVPPGKRIPPYSLVIGTPGRVTRELTKADIQDMERIRKSYVEKGKYYKGILTEE